MTTTNGGDHLKHDRVRVYISGPYTSDPDGNTEAAIRLGQHLLKAGFAPMVPHLTHFWHERYPNPWDTWLELDLPWVAGADAVYRMPGKSSGADAEVEYALRLGIPVFYELRDIVEAERLGRLTPEQPTEQPSVPVPVAMALDRIFATFAKKNADYAEDGAWRSNFEDIAHQMGCTAGDAAEVLIAVKQARLRSMTANGRSPINEGVVDTKLDRAVYAVIALALLLEDSEYSV
jgi:hypothetical protein